MRDKIIERLYELSSGPYTRLMKNKTAWNVTKEDLLNYPSGSLGLHLGQFLDRYNLSIQPKLENHDIFHILTQTEVKVADEIGMQYYLYGNGKRSLYLYMVASIGFLFYPLLFPHLLKQYRRGKKALPFHHLDYEHLLYESIDILRHRYLIR